MSMKLDENSFNLKEKAEIKGGGIPNPFGNGLPKGFDKVKYADVKTIIEKINDTQINDDTSLIKIKKSSSIMGKDIPEFTKFNKLFGEIEKGKSLQFLKASFFKTDVNTIYTYSEHRTPMELVEDFSEYYKIEFERLIKSKVIRAFVVLINIIYLLCKKIKLNNKKKLPLSYVDYIITLLEENENDSSSSLKKIFITDFYKNEYDDDKLKNIKEGEKINNLNIFDLIFSNNISLNFIITKLYELSIYLNETIKETNISIFNPELYDKLKGENMNHDNYLYLYDAIEKNLENFSSQLPNIKKDTKEYLKNLTANFIPLLNNIKTAFDDILTINTVLNNLQNKIKEVNDKYQITHETNVEDKIKQFKNLALNEQKIQKENEQKKQETEESYKKTYDEGINFMNEIYKKSGTINYGDERLKYPYINANIRYLYDILYKEYMSSKVKNIYKDRVNEIYNLINENKERLRILTEIQNQALKYQENINNKLKKIKSNGELIQLNFPEKVLDGMVNKPEGPRVDNRLINEIPNNISKWLNEINGENIADNPSVDQELSASDSKGGKSNKKELRQKLNTMSIKQLKRLSDKNNIEYGNKNTIKSLINNYMKHI